MTLYVLYSADPWLTPDSKRIEGIFTTRRLLQCAMNKLISLGEMTENQSQQVMCIGQSQLNNTGTEYSVEEIEGNNLNNY